MKILAMLVCMMVSSGVFAECATNRYGRTVCGNGETAGGYNARSGTAWKAEQNQYGVTTTETSQGGEAKTKNGKGVYQSPAGKTCVKTRYNKGCN